jgi:hypothetical protein
MNSDGSTLRVTEQGAYLDGIDGPRHRHCARKGVAEMLDSLTGYLRARAGR